MTARHAPLTPPAHPQTTPPPSFPADARASEIGHEMDQPGAPDPFRADPATRQLPGGGEALPNTFYSEDAWCNRRWETSPRPTALECPPSSRRPHITGRADASRALSLSLIARGTACCATYAAAEACGAYGAHAGQTPAFVAGGHFSLKTEFHTDTRIKSPIILYAYSFIYTN